MGSGGSPGWASRFAAREFYSRGNGGCEFTAAGVVSKPRRVVSKPRRVVSKHGLLLHPQRPGRQQLSPACRARSHSTVAVVGALDVRWRREKSPAQEHGIIRVTGAHVSMTHIWSANPQPVLG